MNRYLIGEEARKVWWWYAPSLLIIAAYTLARIQPLRYDDLFLGVCAALQGAQLSLRLFSDATGVEAFIWSRPIVRRKLFCIRWLLGIGFIGGTTLLMVILLAGGVRSWVHVQLGGMFHPMVRWYELNALWSTLLPGLYGYHFALLFKVYTDVAWGTHDALIQIQRRQAGISLVAVFFSLFSILNLEPLAMLFNGVVWAKVVSLIVYGSAAFIVSLYFYQMKEVKA